MHECFDYDRSMKEGPDFVRLGNLFGDPARANMLNALMDGRALTASELALTAGVALSTASSHLAQLEDGGLIAQRKQGRHRYFSIANQDVGAMLEQLMSFAQTLGHRRIRTGPKDSMLRSARVCYNHLAGEKGVHMLDRLVKGKCIAFRDSEPVVTSRGRDKFENFGIDLDALEELRRPLCRCCLDWSERRNHLAGSLGQALLDRMFLLKWASRVKDSRSVEFNRRGEKEFENFLAP